MSYWKLRSIALGKKQVGHSQNGEIEMQKHGLALDSGEFIPAEELNQERPIMTTAPRGQVPEALRLADWLQAAVQIFPQRSEDDPGGYASEVDQIMDDAAAELRRQHARIAELEGHLSRIRNEGARIAELEAQLASIGAGGVSGPPMGQPQAMPDLTALTERGAKAWAGVDAQGLREGRWYMVTHDGVATLCEDRRDAEKEAKDADMAWPHSGPHRAVQLVEASMAGFTAADMATASAQGFRDGVASLSANAGEPWTGDPMDWPLPCDLTAGSVTISKGCPLRTVQTRLQVQSEANALLMRGRIAAPPTAQAEGWTKLPGQLPEPGTPVLLDIGKQYPIRAMWAAKHTVEAADDDTDWAEYDEATETYYCPEGWYEWNEHEEIHWAVTETPRAWAPLPPTTSAGSGKGE